MAEIELQNVRKIYPDGTEAVTSFNLSIEDGSFMVLVGPSGCGKTTVLRMVAGLEEITYGTVQIGGRVVNDVPAKERDIAMVFQNYALYPHKSVYDNMAFGLQLRKVDKKEIGERVNSTARVLGLEDMMKKRPGQLSGGQRQRVAMGRAIVREPRAFLMDEPLSNLDAKLRVQMRAEISRLQQSVGVTTMYVTHDQTEAMTLGDKVAVMKKGVLQQVDSPQRLYEHPSNLFVAGFIGSPAMNLVEASVTSENGVMFVEFAGNRLRIVDEALALRPALRRYDGQSVVLGIRPEDMEDAMLVAGAPEDQVIPAVVALRENMGAEVFVHFTVNAPAVLTEDTKELAVDAGAERLEQLKIGASQNTSAFVARMSPKTRVKLAEDIRIYVDTATLHFFDRDTGDSIYDEPPAASISAGGPAPGTYPG
jgi:multiple sugar transport system ATP-binding protein